MITPNRTINKLIHGLALISVVFYSSFALAEYDFKNGNASLEVVINAIPQEAIDHVSMGLLAETPALGKSRPEVGANVYSFPQGSHIIYYVVHEQQLVVFGVLHKRMAPLAHLNERGLT